MNNEGYFQKHANRVRMEMDGRSPRLRLSLIGFCIEQGIIPEVETIQALVNYVAEDVDEFCDMLTSLPVVEDEAEPEASPVRDGYDVLGRGAYM